MAFRDSSPITLTKLTSYKTSTVKSHVDVLADDKPRQDNLRRLVLKVSSRTKISFHSKKQKIRLRCPSLGGFHVIFITTETPGHTTYLDRQIEPSVFGTTRKDFKKFGGVYT
ncbi:hypothetical protein Gasu2_20420 [Galdieria sulphuraria]|nr:hypothetical protein Gasu2_20420 [Galdieria sulphuraria]